MDFLKANYHSHTTRCKHAYGTEREYIEAAIAMGIKEWGFSDHAPIPYRDGYVSGIRMDWSELENYVVTVRSLAQEYKDDIRIYCGLEAEYMPKYFDEQLVMFRRMNLDYLILGQHFWTTEEEGPYAGSPSDDESRIRGYVDSVIRGLSTGSFTYLAHPDLINYTGLDSVYEFEMERLCRAALEKNIPLELNVLGKLGNRNYPSPRFFNIASRVGNEIIFGLDAHDVPHITETENYEACKAMAEQLNLKVLPRLNEFHRI